MSRPWIEFIQSQRVQWRPQALGSRTGIEVKLLSEDAENGALSALIRYPAGWSAPAGALGCDEEFLVLDGGLVAGATRFGPYSYAHWPAGYDADERSSPEGAVVLTFFSATPARAAAGAVDPARLVERIDGFAVPYTGNFHPEFPPGAGRKALYKDPVTGDSSWLLGTLPMRWAERAEVHPTVEEMFLLAGESHGDRGLMRPGAYFWRPPHIPHGPFGTLTGNLYFFRTKGGPLVTNYVEPTANFHWWPRYDPVLPEALGIVAGEAATTDRW